MSLLPKPGISLTLKIVTIEIVNQEHVETNENPRLKSFALLAFYFRNSYLHFLQLLQRTQLFQSSDLINIVFLLFGRKKVLICVLKVIWKCKWNNYFYLFNFIGKYPFFCFILDEVIILCFLSILLCYKSAQVRGLKNRSLLIKNSC